MIFIKVDKLRNNDEDIFKLIMLKIDELKFYLIQKK